VKKISVEQLWESLTAAGIVSGEIPVEIYHHSPWFVRVMLGFAGWIGALFLLSFIGAAMQFIIRDSTASLITGALICAAAVFIFRKAGRKDFAVQFGLATSFTGQMLFIVGLMEMFRWGSSFGYVVLAVFEGILAVVVINSIHRVVSACVAAVSISFALSSYGLQHIPPGLISLGIAIIWLNEFKWAKKGSLVRPVGYGLIIAAAYINGALLMHTPMWFGGGEHRVPQLVTLSYWLGSILNGAVLIFVVYRLLTREGLGLNDRISLLSLLSALAIAVSSFKSPGVSTGLIIVLLGYANGNKVLTGFGIFSLIAYLSHFYYQLDVTLLTKSISLIITGTVFLAARFAFSMFWPEKEKRGDKYA